MKKKVLTALILVTVGAVIYFSRQIFYFKYEPEYYENLYYHSQWNIPNSTRGISDGDLYKFVGYRLVEGENPFYINYEVPPFGKYLYGLAEKAFGNPYWVSLGLYFASILVLFMFAKDLFNDWLTSLLSLFLFITSPFVATQVRETMLDLPLMAMYLFHAWLMVRFLKEKTIYYLIAAGVFLGLATGIKAGVYTPFVLILGMVVLWLTKTKKFKDLILYVGSVFGGYVLSYFCYFIRHPNPIPWLRLHKKPLTFYLSPNNQVNYLNQWKGIFLNVYQGWWQSGKTIGLGDWSLLLPLGVITALFILYSSIKSKESKWLYISGLTLVFLGVNTIIPFWPRYLMPIIPLFALLIVKAFKKAKWVVFVLALLNLPFFKSSMVNFDPTGDVNAAANFISTRAYRELYRSIKPEERYNIQEEEFIKNCEDFYSRLGTRDINVKINQVRQDGNKANADVEIIYLTKYGELNQEKKLQYERIRNQWRLDWSWDYLWENYNPELGIEIDEDTIPFYRLYNAQGSLMAYRGEWKMVYVIPRLMFDWNDHLNKLSELTNLRTMEIDERIKRFVPDRYPRFVGYLDPALGDEGIEKAESVKGVVLKDIQYALVSDTFENKLLAKKKIDQLINKQPEIFFIRAEGSIDFPELPKGDIIIRLD